MEKLVGYAVRRRDNGRYYAGYGIKDGAAFIHWEAAPDRPRTLDSANCTADFCERVAAIRCGLDVVAVYSNDFGTIKGKEVEL